MTVSLMILPAILITAISFFITFMSAANLKKNIVLNTTLPKEAHGDARVAQIVKNYKKALGLSFLVVFLLGCLIPFVPYMSLLFTLLFVLIALMFGLGEVLLRRYSGELRALKMKEGWFVGKTDVVTVDLMVSREKGKMPVAIGWFLPPILVTASLFGWAYLTDASYFTPVHQLIGIVFFVISWFISARERTVAYSRDSEINLAMAKVSINSWTKCWVQLAWLYSFWSVLQALFLQLVVIDIFVLLVLSEVVLLVVLIILTGRKIRLHQNRLLAGVDQVLLSDDDRYWHWLYYNNPHDNRLLVEKRIGYGQILNIGTTRGKIIGYGTLISVLVLLVVFTAVFLAMDFSEFGLDVTAEHVIVRAPLYGLNFQIDEIKSVSLVDSLPRGMRTNGAETTQSSLGNFTLHGYGKSKLFVYHEHPPYLVIELENLYVIFNARDPEKTKEHFTILSKEVF